ncbi:MAG TPA: hypothetical protein PLT25_02185 [Acidocella sp.]|nr:hypothetical protein [Acidocella sp.]
MLKRVIAGCNAAPGAPADWNEERDGPCCGLPIRVVRHADGTPAYCESAWEPTPREIETLAAGGSVILRVVGWQVPVALYVEPAAAPEGVG